MGDGQPWSLVFGLARPGQGTLAKDRSGLELGAVGEIERRNRTAAFRLDADEIQDGARAARDRHTLAGDAEDGARRGVLRLRRRRRGGQDLDRPAFVDEMETR